jgi:nucleoside-diphosphate-sugar epimerase
VRILISGASGYVGSRLLARFADDGFDVIALHRSPWPDALESISLHKRVSLLRADLCKPMDIKLSVDAAVHAAALSRPNLGTEEDYAKVNVDGTRNFLNVAYRSGAHCLFNLSSTSVYGEILSPFLDESTESVNPDAYGQSKLMAERVLKEAADRIPSLSVRLPGILGAGAQDPWLARIATKAVKGEPIQFFNAEQAFNGCIHIDDIYAAAKRYIMAPGQGADVITYAAREPIPVAEVIRLVVDGLNSSSHVEALDAKRSHFLISIERACKNYDMAPMSVSECVSAFLAETFKQINNGD